MFPEWQSSLNFIETFSENRLPKTFYTTFVFASNATVKNLVSGQCDQKKSPNVYRSCPKMISLEN